jgi:hypothetical protein
MSTGPVLSVAATAGGLKIEIDIDIELAARKIFSKISEPQTS